jgi:hypothetical protein
MVGRSLSNTLRIQVSESKPDTPGFCPDLAAAAIVFGEPARSVSEAGPAATAAWMNMVSPMARISSLVNWSE